MNIQPIGNALDLSSTGQNIGSAKRVYLVNTSTSAVECELLDGSTSISKFYVAASSAITVVKDSSDVLKGTSVIKATRTGFTG